MNEREARQVINEILEELTIDRFVHGDLQNPGNILLLKGNLPPALIDLSLSRDIDEASIRALGSFIQEAAVFIENIKSQKEGISFEQILGSPQFSKVAQSFYALLDPALSDIEGRTAESILIDIITKRDEKKNHEELDLIDLIHAMESHRTVFNKDTMFLLELLHVLASLDAFERPDPGIHYHDRVRRIVAEVQSRCNLFLN